MFKTIISFVITVAVFLFKKVRPPKASITILLNGKAIDMDKIGPDNKRIYSVAIKDNKGRPAKVEGVPVWTVSPTGGVLLFPAADGLTCEVAWDAPLATQTLKVEGDADLGAGVTLISDTIDIETTPNQAATMTLTAGPEIPL